MRQTVFTSVFAPELATYLEHRVNSGFKDRPLLYKLKKFDRFCEDFGLTEPVFTKEHANEWIKRRDGEASTTHYSRINTVKKFLSFLANQRDDVFVTRDIAFKPTTFQPHIYTWEEIRKYFFAVDAFSAPRNRKDAIQYPVLFRLLYCCGTRINETLSIHKKDVDLEAGIIRLVETKNNCERYIVLGDGVASLMREFSSKSFYLLDDEDYIFTSSNGGRLSADTVYQRHRCFLRTAGIPYLGGTQGPRIQDWRHTFAVYAFKQLADAGVDLYVALPTLSTYLGHKTIYATEHYLRLTMSMYPDIERKFRAKMDTVFAEQGNHENH
ncbi:MAG: tyrosine-type recombinase/integrase [Limnochordia bacterium]|nr:tyrosine-type recombinase/integrase [Limnochordia bacterium]